MALVPQVGGRKYWSKLLTMGAAFAGLGVVVGHHLFLYSRTLATIEVLGEATKSVAAIPLPTLDPFLVLSVMAGLSAPQFLYTLSNVASKWTHAKQIEAQNGHGKEKA
jgi:hypothetical protein